MNLPIVDIKIENTIIAKKNLGYQIYQNLREEGCFFIKNTIFSDDYTSKLYQSCFEFLDLPNSRKKDFEKLHRFKDKLISAYLAPGAEQIDYTGQTENKEVLEFWVEGGYNTDYILTLLKCSSNVVEDSPWLSNLLPLRNNLLYALEHILKYVYFLSGCLALYLEEEEDFFSKNFGGNNNFRFTRAFSNKHYLNSDKEEIIRIGAHEDHGCFSCIIHEKGYESGFQVYKKKNGWQNVPQQKDMIYIHSGNMLSLWTNGKIPATLHRVIDPGWKNNRHAINVFIGTNQDVIVKPLYSCIDNNTIEAPEAPPIIAKNIYKIATDNHARHTLGIKK